MLLEIGVLLSPNDKKIGQVPNKITPQLGHSQIFNRGERVDEDNPMANVQRVRTTLTLPVIYFFDWTPS